MELPEVYFYIFQTGQVINEKVYLKQTKMLANSKLLKNTLVGVKPPIQCIYTAGLV